MIAGGAGWDGPGPDEPTPWAALDAAPSLAELEAEARAAADADPVARHDLAYLTPKVIADAALTRANLAAQEAEATRPLSPEEAAQAYVIAKAEATRLGFATVAEYLDAVDPLPPPRLTTGAGPFPEPEDRGTATLSALGEVEYVDDLVRPGRIVVVAAEEGAGKSFAIGGELAVRVAVAHGSFAGTWPVHETGPVLYLSEMHGDDDFGREATVLDSLGLERPALTGRYYRLPLMTAAGGRPALMVPEWRAWVTGWLRDHGALLMVVDTATGATQVDPWGREIQSVYAALRVMLAEYPDLAIVLLIHLKKPQGRGERRISDVLGEWGRWCDVVILMENDGNGLTRARLTVRKRVRHERRIVVTKAGGLLINPQDLDEAKGTKVSAESVIAAVVAKPGMTYVELGAALGVSKDTASNYVKALGDRLNAVKGMVGSGPGARVRVYPIAESPNIAEQARFGDPSAMGAVMEGERSPNAESPSIDRRSASAIPLAARSPIEEPEHRTSEHDQRSDVSDHTLSDGDGSAELADLLVEEDYPRSAWDPNAGDDDPETEGLLVETDAGGAP